MRNIDTEKLGVVLIAACVGGAGLAIAAVTENAARKLLENETVSDAVHGIPGALREGVMHVVKEGSRRAAAIIENSTRGAINK